VVHADAGWYFYVIVIESYNYKIAKGRTVAGVLYTVRSK